MLNARHLVGVLCVTTALACTSNDGNSPSDPGTGGTSTGGTPATGGDVSKGGATGGAPIATGSGGTSAGAASGGGVTGGSGGSVAGSGGNGGQATIAPCSPPTDIKNPPEKLSQTGCMNPSDLRKMADFVIPYDVNSPLWSDGANKQRGMVLPAGGKIHVRNCTATPSECSGMADDGHWDFPVGTVLLKNFSFDEKLVETRLFVRSAANKWVGYGYQWDEAQTDATVVPDEARTVMFNTGTRTVPWTYPSRYDCMLCHNKPGGSSLGPETKQLNRMMNGENLLDKLEKLGVFDAPLPKPYAAPLPTPYPGPEGSPPAGATTDELARSYMHANCGFCHRPGGDIQNLDLRWGLPLSEMALCKAMPQKGGAGLETGSLLEPGDPSHSILYVRMQTLSFQDRMPQIGTYVADDQGVKLIGDWITSLQACP
jgi:uncharacterized repeat protein (TIGR03806 family)